MGYEPSFLGRLAHPQFVKTDFRCKLLTQFTTCLHTELITRRVYWSLYGLDLDQTPKLLHAP